MYELGEITAHDQVSAFLSCLQDAVNKYNEEDETPEWFDPESGICDNWSEYTDAMKIPRTVWAEGRIILKGKFLRSGLDSWVPFNDNIEHYQREADSLTIWKNLKRLSWLQEQAS